MGTIGVAATAELAGIVAAQRPDVLFVDAPVSGTRAPAEAGELLILASGPERAKALLEPAFGAVGRATRWLGEAGAGSRLKLVINTWLMFLIEGAAEVMALADAVGVDRSEVLDLLGTGRMAVAGGGGQGPQDGQRRRLAGLRPGVGGQGPDPGPGRRARPVA